MEESKNDFHREGGVPGFLGEEKEKKTGKKGLRSRE
jgi:hypothetical protein